VDEQLTERVVVLLKPIGVDTVCAGVVAVRADRRFEPGIAREIGWWIARR